MNDAKKINMFVRNISLKKKTQIQNQAYLVKKKLNYYFFETIIKYTLDFIS